MINPTSVRVRDVYDGTNNTLFVGEVTGGDPGNQRGWVWPEINVTMTVHGMNCVATTPGNGFYYGRILDVGFSSHHPRSCHFLRADGSVRIESENFDAVTLAASKKRRMLKPFLNPGQGDHWITIGLVGTITNGNGISTRISVVVT